MEGVKNDITVKWELRLCTVDKEAGYFHCWEHYSRPVPAGLTIGSPPSGVISGVSGIVEFHNRVERVDPERIRFCDEDNAYLQALRKYEIDISRSVENDEKK